MILDGAESSKMAKKIIAQMPEKNWERIFGSEEERQKRFKAALEEQKKRESAPIPRRALAGITDDRLYKHYDAGAGKTHTGYADWKRWQKENNAHCTG
jgi:hypothetical protein